MIKCNSGNMSSDCTTYGHVITDCATVGRFVEEAVKIYSDVTFRVGDAVFNVKGHGVEFRYDSAAEIESVDYTCGWTDEITFIIKTKPKTVRRDGWVAVIKVEDRIEREVYGNIYETLEAAKYHNCHCGYPIAGFAHIEWEEVAQ